VLELGRREEGVDRHEDAADECGGVGGRDPFRPVAHEQRDAGARLDAGRDEGAGVAANLVLELVVGPAMHRAARGGEGARRASGGAGRRVDEQAAEGEGPDPRLGVDQRPLERGHPGSWTSTGPFAITEPSWVLITTSRVTIPAPTVSSSRVAITS